MTLSIEPTVAFNERSGMATSTRNHALELWGPRLPAGDPEQLARVLFRYDNPPGTVDVSGSQDAIGIALPGLARSYYDGGYWPTAIESVCDEATLRFVENALSLIPLGPREEEYRPKDNRRLTREGARALAEAAEDCWGALRGHDLARFAAAFRRSFEAQVELFPNMVTPVVRAAIDRYREAAPGLETVRCRRWRLSDPGRGGAAAERAPHPRPPRRPWRNPLNEAGGRWRCGRQSGQGVR